VGYSLPLAGPPICHSALGYTDLSGRLCHISIVRPYSIQRGPAFFFRVRTLWALRRRLRAVKHFAVIVEFIIKIAPTITAALIQQLLAFRVIVVRVKLTPIPSVFWRTGGEEVGTFVARQKLIPLLSFGLVRISEF